MVDQHLGKGAATGKRLRTLRMTFNEKSGGTNALDGRECTQEKRLLGYICEEPYAFGRQRNVLVLGGGRRNDRKSHL